MKTLYISAVALILVLSACNNSSNTPTSETETQVLDSTHYISTTLAVSGMTCEGCEQTISKKLMDIDGVDEVIASHIDSTAKVFFDTTKVDIAFISANIDTLGYKVTN